MLTLVTPPEGLPVSLAEAKAQLGIKVTTVHDAMINRLIAAVTAKLDGESGMLGRALVTQEWTMTLDYFPAEIVVPLPPLQSVEEITYLDAAGEEQTLATNNYAVLGIAGSKRARIVPAYGKTWPATRDFPESVTVSFTAGYGDDEDSVPEPLRAAILLHVGHLFENRETTIVDERTALSVEVTPYGFDDLIAPYRLWGFGS
ncbi:head-tail connector protein [Mesorhizobium sp. ISC11]|uniref:head-tail connector protein n=1 Tax=Mesorhizobium sp. ISC11 TaxID=3076428 RepID=UPI00301C9684